MNTDPFVFAMANPNPEVLPEEAAPYVRVMATGRSDYPNQINNVLAFPGIFRGALDVRAPPITEEMKLAAARGIADVVDRRRAVARTTSSRASSTATWPRVASAVARRGRSAAAPTEAPSSRARERPSAVRVAVTGATGTIGQARRGRAARARRRGHRAVARRGRRGRAAEGRDPVGWRDPLREPAPSAALEGRDAVVHLLGRADRPALERRRQTARSATRGSSAPATSWPG